VKDPSDNEKSRKSVNFSGIFKIRSKWSIEEFIFAEFCQNG
jgi:hypothetical protein